VDVIPNEIEIRNYSTYVKSDFYFRFHSQSQASDSMLGDLLPSQMQDFSA